MNFEWFFYKKTIWEDCRKNKTLRIIVIITQITIIIALIITFLTFSIGFGFKEIIKEKLLNIRGQIIIQKNTLTTNNRYFSVTEKNLLLRKFSKKNLIQQIHGIIESDVIVSTSRKIDRYIFKGLYEDYNPIFFKYFLITENFFRKKLLSHKNVLLSKKVSLSLGLNVGSNIRIDFISFDKKKILLSFLKNL
ncbi:hypothetical protein [Blattabacterium sp. DPU]|uniref:hypothetical protein n=1 Tax=Blattabacterium sp. DPU TaxID=2715232 RepID=UPI001F617007|nr:hypothetical protein [Blattabacterium sp. DPU]